jgi:hypothetical protein
LKDELATGMLSPIDVPGLEIFVPVILVYRRDRHFTPLQQALLDRARAHAASAADGAKASPRSPMPHLAVVKSRRS